jgi:hypothetical protein
MPFVIDAVLPHDETVTKTLEVLGHPAEVTYYRNRLTLDGAKDVSGATPEEVVVNASRQLADKVAAWDLTGPFKRADGGLVVDAGAPVPVAVEVIRHFPLPLIRALNEAITLAELDAGNAPRRPQP